MWRSPARDCGGSRYQKDAAALYRTRKDGTQAESLPRLMEMSVDEALGRLFRPQAGGQPGCRPFAQPGGWAT